MVELGEVILGRLAPATEQELERRGWRREANTGMIVTRETQDFSAEQAREINIQIQRGQERAIIPRAEQPTPERYREQIAVKTPPPPTREEIRQRVDVARTKLEVRPITEDGKVTGFYDRRLGMSYTIENIPAERLEALKQAQFIRELSQEEKAEARRQELARALQEGRKVYYKPEEAGGAVVYSEEEASLAERTAREIDKRKAAVTSVFEKPRTGRLDTTSEGLPPKTIRIESVVREPTFIERVKSFVGRYSPIPFPSGKEVYGQLFEEGTPSYSEITSEKAIADISEGLLITAPRKLGELPGQVLEYYRMPTYTLEAERKMGIPLGSTTPFPKGFDYPKELGPLRDITIPATEVGPKQIKTIGGYAGGFLPYIFVPPAALLAGGTAIALSPEKTTETRVEGLFLAGAGALGIRAGLKRPIVEYRRPAIPEPIARDLTFTGEIAGKPKQISLYKITQEIPGMEARITTPLRKFVEKEYPESWLVKPRPPEKIIWKPTILEPTKLVREPDIFQWGAIQKKRIKEIITPKPVIGERPFIVEEYWKTPYAKVRKVQLISGVQAPVEYEQLKKITNIDKRILQELAGRLESEGARPIAAKRVPKVLEKYQITMGDIYTEKLGKYTEELRRYKKLGIKVSFKKFMVEPYGRRTGEARYVSGLKQVSIPEELPFEKYVGELTFKPTTPGRMPRAAGKIPTMKQEVFVLKEPIDITKTLDLSDFDFIPPKLKARISKDVFTKQIQKTIQEQELISIPKVFPKVPKLAEPTIAKTITEAGIEKARAVPRRVGAAKDIYPEFIGKERLMPLETMRDISISAEKPIKRLKPIERQMPIERQILTERLMPVERLKLVERLKQSEILKEIQKEKLVERLKPAEKLKSIERLKQKERLKEGLKIRMSMFDIPPPRRGRVLPPKIKPVSSNRDYKKSMKRLLGYDVFKIVKGKPQAIARGITRETGLDIGTRETLKSLRATFFIRKSDLLARDIETGGEFRRYSQLFREPTAKSRYKGLGEIYIQRQSRTGMFGGRLAFRGERAEIQEARMRRAMEAIA